MELEEAIMIIEHTEPGYRTAMQAFIKQIPKIPEHAHIDHMGTRSGICRCGKHLEESDNFCSNCGQAIAWWSWSDEDWRNWSEKE